MKKQIVYILRNYGKTAKNFQTFTLEALCISLLITSISFILTYYCPNIFINSWSMLKYPFRLLENSIYEALKQPNKNIFKLLINSGILTSLIYAIPKTLALGINFLENILLQYCSINLTFCKTCNKLGLIDLTQDKDGPKILDLAVENKTFSVPIFLITKLHITPFEITTKRKEFSELQSRIDNIGYTATYMGIMFNSKLLGLGDAITGYFLQYPEEAPSPCSNVARKFFGTVPLHIPVKTNTNEPNSPPQETPLSPPVYRIPSKRNIFSSSEASLSPSIYRTTSKSNILSPPGTPLSPSSKITTHKSDTSNIYSSSETHLSRSVGSSHQKNSNTVRIRYKRFSPCERGFQSLAVTPA